jgi:MtN3 and saliva related transmembrane protein
VIGYAGGHSTVLNRVGLDSRAGYYIETLSMKPITLADLVGWASTAVLLATIGRQVYSQWKSKATAGVSRWLFIGQISASIGFIIYSSLLHNWIFIVSNIAMIITAIVGESIYIGCDPICRQQSLPEGASGCLRGDHEVKGLP